MSIASQPGKFKSNLSKSRTICPNRVKTNFSQNNWSFVTNLRFLSAIGLFTTKSGINHWNSNFTAKTNLGDPRTPLTLHMRNPKSKFSNHKNSNNSKAIGSSNLKLCQKLLTIGMHYPAKCQSPTPSGSKVIDKKVHFSLLSRPLLGFISRPWIDSFPDPTWIDSFPDPIFAKYSITHMYTKVPFKTPIGAIVIITFVQNAKFDHFKTLDLVYFQDHGRWTANFSAPKVWLARRGPATGIWWVEGSDHPSITCIQHQSRHLVCNDHQISR